MCIFMILFMIKSFFDNLFLFYMYMCGMYFCDNIVLLFDYLKMDKIVKRKFNWLNEEIEVLI